MAKWILPLARVTGGAVVVVAVLASSGALGASASPPAPDVDVGLVAPGRAAVGWSWEAVLATIVYGGIGIAMAIIGFKLFDLFTPGRLEAEICEKQNVAAGLLGAAVVLGISLIIAAAIL